MKEKEVRSIGRKLVCVKKAKNGNRAHRRRAPR